MQPPAAAKIIPIQKPGRMEPQPPAGGWLMMETMAFTTGAPAKTMAMTTAGEPFAPKASNTPNAPMAPMMPATSDQIMPAFGIDHDAPDATSMPRGASTATRK